MMKITMALVSKQMLFSKNQMVTIMVIVLSCLSMAIMMFLMSTFHWFSMMILLVYISGIMVLFMFIVSLTPNSFMETKKMEMVKMILICIFFTSVSKSEMNSENLKSFSILKWSSISMLILMVIIMMMAYMPTKMMKSMNKGMKSSK